MQKRRHTYHKIKQLLIRYNTTGERQQHRTIAADGTEQLSTRKQNTTLTEQLQIFIDKFN
jgi:hypothetical protein